METPHILIYFTRITLFSWLVRWFYQWTADGMDMDGHLKNDLER